MGVSSKNEVCGNLCQCGNNNNTKNAENLFSPIKNKMKVLKKIKKRMGLGKRCAKLIFFPFFVLALTKKSMNNLRS
jgi:hypothetical protein